LIDNHDSNARATFQVAVRAFHCCLKSVEHFSIPLFSVRELESSFVFKRNIWGQNVYQLWRSFLTIVSSVTIFHNLSNSDALLQKTNSLVTNRSLMMSVAFNFLHIQVSISSKNLRFWLTTFSFVYFVGFTG
jgi:hypothetical protein